MSALHQSEKRRGPNRASTPDNMPRGIGETDDQCGYYVRLIPTTSLSSGGCSLRGDARAHEMSISELANSIAASGVIEPIIVRPLDGDGFEVIVGERRLAAAKIVGLPKVPCIVRTCSRSGALLMSLTENVQRSDLNAIERARAFRRLLDEFHLTQGEISKQIGISQSAIAHHLRLLLLPPEVQRLIEQGSLSMGHGKLLAALSDSDKTVELALKCVSESSSVRQLEELLGSMVTRQARPDGLPKTRSEHELPNGVFLVIKESPTEPVYGTIEIPYYSRDEKEWVMATLSRAHERSRQVPRRQNARLLEPRLVSPRRARE